MKYVTREVCIIDDDDYEEYLKDYVRKEDDVILDYFCDNPELSYGYKSLSNTEKTVIFLYFHENYRIGEIAKILNMNADYISRLKKNALNKLKSYIERGKKNE